MRMKANSPKCEWTGDAEFAVHQLTMACTHELILQDINLQRLIILHIGATCISIARMLNQYN